MEQVFGYIIGLGAAVMLEDFCPVYNGILLNENSGWEQINEGIEVFINKIFQNEH